MIDDTVYGIIAERRESGDKRNDLLQMLIDARDKETGEGMSDRQMRDEVLTIFLAGMRQLLRCSLGASTWLGKARKWMSACAEYDMELAGRTPTMEDLNKMTYTAQVLYKAPRMYPPAWMFARTSIEDDEIGGYRIPAGQ